MPGQLLAMNPGTADLPLDGIPTVEPSFGLPAVWIGEAQREQAEISGYTVVDPTSLLVTHLSEVIRRNAAELLGRQDVRALLDALKERLPAPVEELVPDLMTVGEVQRVLQTLLSEAVPIRDLVTILETLGDKAKLTKDVPILAEYCRQALARAICGRFVDETGTLRAITLDPEVDREIAESVAPHRGRHRGDHGPRPRLGAHRHAQGAGRARAAHGRRRRSCSARAPRAGTSRRWSPTRSPA